MTTLITIQEITKAQTGYHNEYYYYCCYYNCYDIYDTMIRTMIVINYITIAIIMKIKMMMMTMMTRVRSRG